MPITTFRFQIAQLWPIGLTLGVTWYRWWYWWCAWFLMSKSLVRHIVQWVWLYWNRTWIFPSEYCLFLYFFKLLAAFLDHAQEVVCVPEFEKIDVHVFSYSLRSCICQEIRFLCTLLGFQERLLNLIMIKPLTVNPFLYQPPPDPCVTFALWPQSS